MVITKLVKDGIFFREQHLVKLERILISKHFPIFENTYNTFTNNELIYLGISRVPKMRNLSPDFYAKIDGKKFKAQHYLLEKTYDKNIIAVYFAKKQDKFNLFTQS